jgi:hypothetical protein
LTFFLFKKSAKRKIIRHEKVLLEMKVRHFPELSFLHRKTSELCHLWDLPCIIFPCKKNISGCRLAISLANTFSITGWLHGKE